MKKIAVLLATIAALFPFSASSVEARFLEIDVPELPKFSAAAFILLLIRLLIIGAFILALIFLLIGGVRWITSGGDPKAIESAKGQVTAAVIGLLLVVSAFAIVGLVEFFFEVDIISAPLKLPHI